MLLVRRKYPVDYACHSLKIDAVFLWALKYLFWQHLHFSKIRITSHRTRNKENLKLAILASTRHHFHKLIAVLGNVLLVSLNVLEMIIQLVISRSEFCGPTVRFKHI